MNYPVFYIVKKRRNARMKTEKILITGATGFLGSRISYYYKNKYDQNEEGKEEKDYFWTNILTPGRKELDLWKTESIIKYMEENRPSLIFHTAAFADTSYCETHPEDSYEINVRATKDLAKAAADLGSEFIFMSSDAIYNGNGWKEKILTKEGYNREGRDDHPVNVYGKHKKEAEELIFETGGKVKALRLTWMYDAERETVKNNRNLITNLQEAKRNQSAISFALHEFRGITNVWEVVKNLEKAVILPTGSYNFGSPNIFPTITVARKAGRLLGVREELIKEDRNRWLPDGRNLAICQEKLNAHGIYFHDTMGGLEYFVQDAFSC